MVWIEVASALAEEDPVQIAQLQAQITELQSQVQTLNGQLEGLTQGLAHVADVIVPELASAETPADRRAELSRTAGAIREQFIGPPPVRV
jgi:multidrug resistance efflux pump